MKKLFIPAYSLKSPERAVKRALRLLKGYKTIGIITTAQHINQISMVKRILEREGHNVIEGGQILGCNIESAKKIENSVDVFLYIGSGRFHPLGVAYATRKPVITANPLSDFADTISKEEILQLKRKRRARILRAYNANVFGILVSLKNGQFNLERAFQIKDRMERAGRRAFIFAGSEINNDNILPFRVEAWVNTACPRIVDDYFDKPVLNEGEIDILIE
ncbi:MAG: hypothetical protein DRO92_03110 [Candidatus Altiarchaeales archaeon]|nr:MAG: hypothetical protein DRO92_03110 [Candidatus Altiarchaeales archaeon]